MTDNHKFRWLLFGMVVLFAGMYLYKKFTVLDVDSLSNTYVINYEQVGYYRSDKKVRFRTFNITTERKLNVDSLPQDFIYDIKEHGEKQYRTEGCVSSCYYYINRHDAPDISDCATGECVFSRIEPTHPDIGIWINPRGETLVNIKPFE